MTTSRLVDDTARFEGFRGTAYADPESPLGLQLALPLARRAAAWALLSGDPWTYGFGSTRRPDGTRVQPGDTIALPAANLLLAETLANVEAELDFGEPWWRTLCDPRQDVLAGMAYNLGEKGFETFTTFIGLLKSGDFTGAADDLINHTVVGRQLHTRYSFYADVLRKGTYG